MSLKYSLLGLLNYSDLTGYELNKIFKRSLFYMWKAQMSQIYRELNNMEKAGWLSSRLISQSGAPNKKIYSINELGRNELCRWLSETDENDLALPQHGFLIKIFFSGEIDPAISLDTLRKFRQSRLIWLENFQDATGGLSSSFDNIEDEKKQYWVLVGDLSIEAMKMEIQWAENCIAALEKINNAKKN